ncbi:MAG: pyridoxal phosphate-dependent aminotransferase [Ruminococcus sp.]|nr:pyridoxal phosphate-dependent aminotransferase [Ruminococcus sp.]
MNSQLKMQLSDKVNAIPEALSVYMNNVVYAMRRRGDSIKVLSLGEAFFEIPMFPFDEIDFKKGYHYSESRGMPELRHIVAKYYKDKYGAVIDPEDELLISAGSKPLIYMAFQSVLNPGDEVLIHEPAWLSYPEEIKLADGVPKFIPYDCLVEDFDKYFTDKTRMVVICNPNNPAGKMYSKADLERLYEMCRPRGIYILVDEAYSDFVIDDGFTSMASVVPDKDGIIVVNSLSKNLGISGWRIGYVISSPDVIYNVLKLNQHLITCPATLLSMYVAHYFDDIVKVTLPQAQAVVEKRQKITNYMKSIGLKPLDGSATFYIFMSIENYKHSSMELGLYLLMKYGISVVPGLAYGDSTERFIRIGVGAETTEDIEECLRTIKRVIEENEYDDDFVDSQLKELHMNRFTPAK